MNSFSMMMIGLLFHLGTTAMINAADTETDWQQDTTVVCKKDYPKYSMTDFDTKELAELLLKEKMSGKPNDSSFADFFRRCGMEYGKLPEEYHGYLEHRNKVVEGYYKIYSGKKAFIKVISVYDKSEDGKLHHTIEIEFPKSDVNRLQWMTVQLRAFGMKDMRSEAVKLEGRGIRGLGMRGFFKISY